MSKNELVQQVMDDYGLESIEDILLDSTVPAVCKYCKYTTDLEPDCTNGYCENCNKQSMVSVLVLLGMI